jgi:hypothetical protein
MGQYKDTLIWHKIPIMGQCKDTRIWHKIPIMGDGQKRPETNTKET